MAYKVPIYLIVKPTGQFTEDGTECVLILESKLTRISAERTAGKYEGAVIMKLYADKNPE